MGTRKNGKFNLLLQSPVVCTETIKNFSISLNSISKKTTLTVLTEVLSVEILESGEFRGQLDLQSKERTLSFKIYGVTKRVINLSINFLYQKPSPN